MTDNEKLAELYAQFAKEKDVQKLTQITDEIAGVLAAKEERVKHLHDEIRAVGIVSRPRTPNGVTTEHERPSFGGKPGELVPRVDPDDLKTVWQFFKGSLERSEWPVTTGADFLQRVCKPGADVQALSYRAMMLSLLIRHAQQQLAPRNTEGELDDNVFRAAAEIPMEWIGVGITRRGLPFDVEDFMRRLRG
jgi:hypothetical protein